MYREILSGFKQEQQSRLMNFKKLSFATVDVFIDNESTHCNIYSDKNPQEQTLIYDIRRMQQMINDKDLRKFHLVDTKIQLADVFTKQTKPSNIFMRATFDGYLDNNCKCCYIKDASYLTTGVVEKEDCLDHEYDTGPESPVQTESEGEDQQQAG